MTRFEAEKSDIISRSVICQIEELNVQFLY